MYVLTFEMDDSVISFFKRSDYQSVVRTENGFETFWNFT